MPSGYDKSWHQAPDLVIFRWNFFLLDPSDTLSGGDGVRGRLLGEEMFNFGFPRGSGAALAAESRSGSRDKLSRPFAAALSPGARFAPRPQLPAFQILSL